MPIKTFKRYEVKYLVTPDQYRIIRSELDKYMVLDKFCRKKGSYMIYNVYFDTENDDVIRRSLAKPYYKEKLRMRSYTIPVSGEEEVFLELKKKIGGIVTKRRAILTLNQANNFLKNGLIPDCDDYKDRQVLAEIADFLSRYPAKPKVFISYERTAFFAKDNPELRVSFDENILTRRDQVDLSSGDFGTDLLADDRILMEVKCEGHIPLWLCQLLSQLKIYKTTFSKYGTEYKNYVKSRSEQRKYSQRKTA
ncbi:polyphosphate polymerase domain-containing protein [Dehalobacter sp. DCM]|uniref:polyphosphate polymerase domain-containing protein n=1 Tax=Dehalobacter sp. DCM TaxID=2907827 RepID=UPI003082145F|nr:polyphosphate polymerase domain-containing protein [Dehalobacter sp. DCM]